MAETVPELYRPYADAVEKRHGREYSWLVDFLRKGVDVGFTIKAPPEGLGVWILDSVEGKLHEQAFLAPFPGNQNQDQAPREFVEALNNRPSNSHCRIVLVECATLSLVNGAYIDAIGMANNLPAHFVQEHFYAVVDQNPNLISQRPILLASEIQHLQVLLTRNSYLTAHFERLDISWLVTVFVMEPLKLERLKVLREFILQKYSRTEVLAADIFPVDYLYEYIYQNARQLGKGVQYDTDMLEQPGMKSSEFHEASQVLYRRLVRNMESISRLVDRIGSRDEAKSGRVSDLLSDYAALIKSQERVIEAQKSRLQHSLASQSIEEARRGIEQADSVRRLTFVAFVFLPLNFATSFFGMNLKQLHSGSVNIGYFFLLLALSGLMSFILSFSVQRTEKFWADARRKYAIRESGYDTYANELEKKTVMWGYFRHRVAFLQSIHEEFEDTKYFICENENIDVDDVSTIRVFNATVRQLASRLFQRVWMFLSHLFIPKSEDHNSTLPDASTAVRNEP